MADEDGEIGNPFHYPPSHYKNNTKANHTLLALLRERTETSVHDPISLEQQRDVLGEQSVDLDLTALERPRADWIVEEGWFEAFGDKWPVCATIPASASRFVDVFCRSRRGYLH